MIMEMNAINFIHLLSKNALPLMQFKKCSLKFILDSKIYPHKEHKI